MSSSQQSVYGSFRLRNTSAVRNGSVNNALNTAVIPSAATIRARAEVDAHGRWIAYHWDSSLHPSTTTGVTTYAPVIHYTRPYQQYLEAKAARAANALSNRISPSVPELLVTADATRLSSARFKTAGWLVHNRLTDNIFFIMKGHQQIDPWMLAEIKDTSRVLTFEINEGSGHERTTTNFVRFINAGMYLDVPKKENGHNVEEDVTFIICPGPNRLALMRGVEAFTLAGVFQEEMKKLPMDVAVEGINSWRDDSLDDNV